MENKKIVPIVVATDDNYVLLLKVFLKSLLYTKKEETVYNVYVFISALTEKNKEWIKREERKDLRISIVDVSKYLVGQDFYAGNYSIATYYRFFAPAILREYKKIIYCDVDTVVNADLGDLADLKIGDIIIAAVNESWGDVEKILQWRHFNAGVLLIDTEKFLKDKVCEKCATFVNEHQDLRFPDQDALNEVLKGNVYQLNARYNYQTTFLNRENIKFYNQMYNINSIKDIAIIHFSGARRPWYYSRFGIKDKLSRKWWFYARRLKRDEKKELKKFHIKGYNIISRNKIFALKDLNNDFYTVKLEKGSLYAKIYYIKNYVKMLLK